MSLSLFAVQKNKKLVKLTELSGDKHTSPEVLYVFDSEADAKEYAVYLEQAEPDHKWSVVEYQLICSTTEWN